MSAEAYKRTFVIFRCWFCSHDSSLLKKKSSCGLLLILADFLRKLRCSARSLDCLQIWSVAVPPNLIWLLIGS
jgi:hypothetical protein